MGNVHKFKRPRRKARRPNWRPRRSRWWRSSTARLLFSLAILGIPAIVLGSWDAISNTIAPQPSFTCEKIRVIDGDTFDCDGRRIRLAGIDAPKMPGHCRKGRDCTPGDPHASTETLSKAMRWKTVTCRPSDTDVYGRTIARCTAGTRDLSCAQLEAGSAVRRYGWIWCS